MSPTIWIEIFVGVLAGGIAYFFTRVALGFRLGLFLLSDDSQIADQALIPITAENKRAAFWRTLFRGRWREDIELTLLDYQNQSFTFKIGYHIVQRFYLYATQAAGSMSLDHEPLKLNHRYYVKSGMKLVIGSRPFKVLIAPATHVAGRDFTYSELNRSE